MVNATLRKTNDKFVLALITNIHINRPWNETICTIFVVFTAELCLTYLHKLYFRIFNDFSQAMERFVQAITYNVMQYSLFNSWEVNLRFGELKQVCAHPPPHPPVLPMV